VGLVHMEFPRTKAVATPSRGSWPAARRYPFPGPCFRDDLPPTRTGPSQGSECDPCAVGAAQTEVLAGLGFIRSRTCLRPLLLITACRDPKDKGPTDRTRAHSPVTLPLRLFLFDVVVLPLSVTVCGAPSPGSPPTRTAQAAGSRDPNHKRRQRALRTRCWSRWFPVRPRGAPLKKSPEPACRAVESR